jgi:hypothetical protein
MIANIQSVSEYIIHMRSLQVGILIGPDICA